MSFKVQKVKTDLSSVVSIMPSKQLGIPSYDDFPEVQSQGSIVYVGPASQLFYSDGNQWIPVNDPQLHPSLKSISEVVTSGNEILYTTGTNTYSKSPITQLSRDLLSSSNQNSLQGIIGTVVGINVQPYSSALSQFSSLSNSSSNNKLIYSTGPGTFSSLDLTSTGQNLLSHPSIQSIKNTLEIKSFPNITSSNSIVIFNDNSGNVKSSSIIITNDNDINNVHDIQFSGHLNNVSAVDLHQLSTIGSNLISNDNWTRLTSLNQDLGTNDNPMFQNLTLNGTLTTNGLNMNSNRITNVATPIGDNDVVNKSYVDSVSISGLNPLEQVKYATTSPLPNSPFYTEPDNDNQVLTSIVPDVSLVIDGLTPSINDRILVKDQVDSKQNGIYVVFLQPVLPGDQWILKRANDFNQTKINSGTIKSNSFVFVENGNSNSNTSWLVKNEILQIRPAISATLIEFVKFSGSQNIVGNDGISKNGNNLNIDATSRFTFSGTSPNKQLELNTVPVTHGGTGLTSLASGKVLVGNNNSLDLTKNSPVGDFVGTSDSQTLINKNLVSNTNTIVADQIWNKSGLPVSIANSPVDGQVLTATSNTSCRWQDVTNNSGFSRVITVGQGGDFTSIKEAADAARTGTSLPSRISGGVASLTNPILIFVSTGVYTEPNPIIVGTGVIITSYTERAIRLSNVKVLPSTSTSTAVFQMSSFSSLEGISIEGANGVGGIGVHVPIGSIDANVTGCQVTDCDTGFQVTGPGTAYLQNNVAENISATKVCNIGFRVTGGASVGSVICVARGDTLSNTPMTIGFMCEGNDGSTRGSGMFGGSCTTILCLTALKISSSSSLPATISWSGSAVLFSILTAIDINTDGIAELYGTTVSNSVGYDVRLRASSSKFIGSGNKIRSDKILFDNINAKMIGQSLSDITGHNSISVGGTLSVGSVTNPSNFYVGGGEDHVQGLKVFKTNSAESAFTDITSILTLEDSVTTTVFPNGTVNDKLYIGGQFKQFPGIELKIITAISPINPDLIIWEYWNGTTWSKFRVMTTDDNHTALCQTTFDHIGEIYVRFGDIINPSPSLKNDVKLVSTDSEWISTNTPSAWTQTTINGVFAYWVRIRLTSNLTTNPVIDRLNLQSHSTKINTDGYIEYFGRGRVYKKIQNINALVDSGINAPYNEEIGISDNLSIKYQSRFRYSYIGKKGWIFELHPDTDTSFPILFEWKWHANGGGSVNNGIRWVVRWGYSRDYEADSGSLSDVYENYGGSTTAKTEREIVIEQAPGVKRKQLTSFVALDISTTIPVNQQGFGDLIFLVLERRGNEDSSSLDAYLTNVSLRYLSWNEGKYIG